MYLIEKALVNLEGRKDEEQGEVDIICTKLFSDCLQILSKYGKRKDERITLIVVVHKTERPIEILLTSGRVLVNSQDSTNIPMIGLNIWIEGFEEHLNLSREGSKIAGRLIDARNSFANRTPSHRDIEHWQEVVEFVKQKHPIA